MAWWMFEPGWPGLAWHGLAVPLPRALHCTAASCPAVPCPCPSCPAPPAPAPCPSHTQHPAIKPASLAALPFVVRRTAPHGGPLRVRVTLHLHETADPDKRTVAIDYTAELQPGLPAGASLRQQRHEFVTQVHEYDAAGQQQQAAEQQAAAGTGGAVEHEAADAAAPAAPAGGAPASPERQQAEKRQRIS